MQMKYFNFTAMAGFGAGLAYTSGSKDAAIAYLLCSGAAAIFSEKFLSGKYPRIQGFKVASFEDKLAAQALNIAAVVLISPVILTAITKHTNLSATFGTALCSAAAKGISHAVFGQLTYNTLTNKENIATFFTYRTISQTVKFTLDDQSSFGKFKAGYLRDFIDSLQSLQLNSITTLKLVTSGAINALYKPTTMAIEYMLGTASMPVKILQAGILECESTRDLVESILNTAVSYAPTFGSIRR